MVAYSGNLGRVHDLEPVLQVAEVLRDDAAFVFLFIGGGAQRAHLGLQRGGRALILDTDWESCVWHSSDPSRMHRVIEAWDTHCPHPHLPRVLGRLLRGAGLEVTGQSVIPLLNPAYAALNQLTGTNAFPTGLVFTLPPAYESHVRVTQPLIQEPLRANVAAAGANPG